MFGGKALLSIQGRLSLIGSLSLFLALSIISRLPVSRSIFIALFCPVLVFPSLILFSFFVCLSFSSLFCPHVNSRAKEQTEAREQYFADLKQQFDEMRVAYDRDLTQVCVIFLSTSLMSRTS